MATPPAPNVLISGFGIASSVFAATLLRAYPHATITIIERDPSMRLTGASVDIRSSAVDIIKWMNLEQAIRAKTTKEEGVEFVDETGKSFATLLATGNDQVQTMTSEYEIFRGDLARIFFKEIEGKVDVMFNESVESYEQQNDAVVVNFANGKASQSYDLLVAADGLGSRIRGMMLGTSPQQHIHDEGTYASFFVIEKDLLNGSKLAKWYTTTGGRAIFLRPDPDPRGRTRGHFMNSAWPSDTVTRNKINTALKEGRHSYTKLVEETFANVGFHQTQEILAAMRKTPDFYCSKFAQVRAPRIQDGRVVLLGDAGYATPGIGTSLAIMGAHILAGELLSHNLDIAAAAKAYEDTMLPFAHGQQSSIGDYAMQMMNPQTKWGLWVRDMVLWALTAARVDRVAVWIASMLGVAEPKIKMPVYPWPEVKA
ncbi:FAD/NAD(P)-binding domain-containing protein [Aureobasidium sp. EXF-10727]|nr:FAD/NAD(P)-binding domain-containing protein [Aureobasidium sp. EXF-10727]